MTRAKLLSVGRLMGCCEVFVNEMMLMFVGGVLRMSKEGSSRHWKEGCFPGPQVMYSR